MAAAVVTAHKVGDGFFEAEYEIVGTVTDTNVSAASVIDASALKGADAAADFHELKIVSVDWESSDVDGVISILADATSDETIFSCPGSNGHAHGITVSPTTGADGFTGDIRLTTTGFANPSAFTLRLKVRKGQGFVSVPTVLAGDFDEDGPIFRTGEDLDTTITLSEPAHVVGIPALELKLSDGGSPAVITTHEIPYSGLVGYVSSLAFSVPITDEMVAEEGDVDLGVIYLKGAGRITGGFAQSPARLTSFSKALTSYSINPNDIVSAVFVNGLESENVGSTDDVWFEDDVVVLTVTFGHPVDVTLDADNSDIKIVVTGDTGSVAFDYVSGSGTKALVFAATIPAAVTAQGEATECDLTAGINLVEDDAIESATTGVAPTGTTDVDWSDLITVADLAINPA